MCKRVGVLISGRGSNLVSLMETAKHPAFPADIVLVLSSREDAEGLERAREYGVACEAVPHRAFESREAFDAALSAKLRAAGVDLVCNAGFMRLHSPAFVEEWRGRQLNIHPSLLPSFRGLHPQRQALEAGVRVTGATVHFVSEDVDAGAIVAQGVVPVLRDDDEERLSTRILALEHRLYPMALAAVATGRVRFEGGRAVISREAGPLLLADPVMRGGE